MVEIEEDEDGGDPFAINAEKVIFGAQTQQVFLILTLEMYGCGKENIDFLGADNCSTNLSTAQLLQVPMIGCKSHLLNLAVKKVLQTEK